MSESSAGATMGAGQAQFLTFALGGEEYGVDILRVQEIKGWTSVTSIPNAPPHVRGVMNLRGTVVPVFDVRLAFRMDAREYDRFTVIVVVSVGTRVVGLIVDAVSDVLDVPLDAIEAPPELGAAVDTSTMRGIARHGERLITLLDIDRVVNLDGTLPSAEVAATA
jgi:purine-binding chemotaxis protein CheW